MMCRTENIFSLSFTVAFVSQELSFMIYAKEPKVL